MRLHSFHQKARLSAASAIDQLRHLLAKPAEGAPAWQLDLSELEDRILLSANPAAVLVDPAPATDAMDVASPLAADSDSLIQVEPASSGLLQIDSPTETERESVSVNEFLVLPPAESASFDTSQGADAAAEIRNSTVEQTATEVIFIDEAAEDLEELVADLQAQRDAGRAIDFFVLDSNTDGIDQIAEALKRYSDLDAVHIVSHGSDGAVKLGATWLRMGSLDGYAGTIAGWGSAFSADGDLLFYGCDLAASSRGELLIDSIAVLTGTDVAASTDDTGSALRGGDWDLEFHNGQVETSVAFSAAAQENWSGLLATVAVTDYLDSDGEPRASTQSVAPTGGLPVPDFDGDGKDGRTIQKDTGSYNTSGSTKFQLWHTDDTGFLVDGNVSFTLYSAMIDFVTDKAGDVRVYLTETDLSGNNALGSPLASATIGTPAFTWSGGWDQDVVNFGTITRFIEPGRALAVKITVGNNADGDMMFAYDTATTPSSLDYDTMTSGVPNLSNLNGDTLNYIEDDGALIIDQGAGASITDGDSPDFDGGLLYVSITSGGDSGEDVLSVRNQGGGSGQIGFSGGTVTYEGTTIGTATGGSGSTPLRIALNANANATSVGALTRNVTYDNTDSANPTTSTRTVNFFLHDGDGGVSSTNNATVTVTRENDAPVLNTAGASTLTTVVTDDFTNSGDRVVDIIASTGDPISDVDIGSQEGIAVTSVDNSNGDWQYSTNGGGAWSSFGSVTENLAVLLDDSTDTRIRFVPNASYLGVATISFRAWDQTFGSNGQSSVDVASIGVGQDKPFSIATEVSTVVVSEIPTTSGIANVNDLEDDPNRDIDLFPSFADSEDADSALTYSVTNNTNAGLFDSTSIISGQFLRLDYKQDQFGTADLTVRATDTAGLFVETVFTVTLAPVNDDPVLDQNNQLDAFTGLTSTIDNTVLAASDVDNTAAEVEFTLTDVPDHGTLRNNGTTLNLSDTFTQADIDADLITYTHNGGASVTDSFAFDLTDNTTGNGGSHTFNMAISPAPPAIDNTTTDTTPKASGSDSFSHTTSGTDRLMLVGVSFGEDKGDTVSSITYNGTALTLVGAQDHSDSSKSRVEIWSLVAPDVGTHNLVVNYSGANHEGATIGVMTFTNVDQATPLGTFAGNQGTSGSPSVTANSGDSELVFGVVAVGDSVNYNFTPGAGQTEQWDLFREKANGSGTTEDGAATVVTSWTYGGSKEWAAGAVSINAASNLATVADNFDDGIGGSSGYSGNDGTENWTGNWVENDSGGPTGGDIRVNGSHELRIVTESNGKSIYREADLSSAATATLTFDSNNTLFGSGQIRLEISNNGGGSWSTLKTYTSGNTGTTAESFDISADAASNTRIRLRVVAEEGSATATFDNFQIEYTAAPAGNTSPTITSNGGGGTAAVNVAENTTSVTTVTATDSDLPAQTLSYSISGGADQTKFNIDSGSGVLTFASAPDFEAPTDANTDNVYEVTVLVSDGQGGTDTQDISVTVTAVNDNSPTIISNGGGPTAAVNVFENTTAATTVTATDADLPAQTLTYSISGGADAAKFNINSGSGVLTFASAPDFASPTDANADNVYEVTVQVSDGSGGTDTQDISVTVSATPSLTPTGEFLVNDTVTDQQVTSGQSRGSQQAVSLAADSSYVVVWTSLNQDGSGQGVYAQRFDTNGSALTAEFRVNQTTASDQQWARVASAADGSFVVTWTSNQGASQDVYYRRFAADGTALTAELIASTNTSGSQTNSVIDMDASDHFVIAWQGNGAGDSTGIFAQRFNLTGNKLGSEFRVNTATTGTQRDPSVSVNGSGDFVIAWEDVSVIKAQRYNSGGVSQGSEITVDSNLLGVSDRPAVGMADDGSFVVVWSDQPLLSSFDISGQQFDSFGNTVGGEFTINTTTSSNQTAPSIAMSRNGEFIVSWEGNGTGDSSGVFARRYLANGTAQGTEFRVNQTTTGTQQFASLAMVDLDNYVVVWSGNGNQAGEVDSSGVFARQYGNATGNTSPNANAGGPYVILEGNSVNLDGSASSDLDADPLTYAWDLDNDGNYGEAGEPTTVSPSVSWATLQSFGITDDGSYTIGVQVDDGNGGVDSATTMLTVNNVSPTITSSASVGIAENTTAVLTVTATDPVDAVTYSLSGGNDQGLFTINSTTGALSFTAAPDFESPADNDGNNVYQVEVTADDGDGGTDVQTISVSVTDVNDETPVITAAQSFNIVESASNGTSLGNVTATDADAGTTFSNWTITGGNTDGVFAINSSTGELTVADNTDLDFDTVPGYVLSLTVSDGTNTSSVETVSISVNDQNDNIPVIDPAQSFNISEAAANGTSLGNVTATDADAGTTFSNWTITGGNTDGIFAINSSTGELTVADNTNLDFEMSPGYVLSLTVSDGTNTSSVETVSVSVVDANEAPSVSLSSTSSSLSENADTSSAIVLATISVTDDALGTNSLSLSGADAPSFEIVGNSLRLRAGTPLDFETKPTYNVTVEVNDPLVGSNPDDSQSFTLTINDVNEAPTTSGLPNVVVNEDSPSVPIDLTTAFSDAETASSLLIYSVLSNSNPALFNAASISGGTLTLDFAADAHGSSVITVQASDPAGVTVSTAFTVTVQPVPDNPVSVSDSYEVTGDSLAVTTSAGVLANDSDADGDALTALLISGPSDGSLVLLSDGGFTYTPDAAFSGIDSFVYQPFDGANTGPARTVTLNVTRAAAPPPPSTSSGSGESAQEESASESETQTDAESGEAQDAEDNTTVAGQESSNSNMEVETSTTSESSDDDGDEEQILASASETTEPTEFFDRDLGRLELRDAGNIRSGIDVTRTVGGPAADVDMNFQNSLRFDGEDLSFLVGTEFIQELEQVEDEFEFDGTVPEWATGTAVATSAGISVGYIMWMLRGGYVLASVMSTMPMWQSIDPLPVLAALDAADADDDESLQSMIDSASEKSDGSESMASNEASSETTRKDVSV